MESFLAQLLLILLSAKVFGELAERWRQPAVLGELLGGVVLGVGLFSFFRPETPVLRLMAEFGVVLLMFETGVQSDLKELLKAGPVSFAVAAVGVAVPFLLGWGAMTALGHGGLPAVFVGAAMTATSVGITARVLADIGRLSAPESQIVLGAAIIDDVIGVVILAAVQGMVATGSFSWAATAKSALLAAAFLAAALAVGPHLTKRLVKVVEGMRVRGVLITGSVCFAFALALLAHALGTALIVGAFTAGILLADTDRKADIDQTLKPLSDVFVPVFFVMVGAQVRLDSFGGLALLLATLAVAGKLASGLAAWGRGLNLWAIGVGMVPRGEVGLIFAGIGLASGAIDGSLYAAIIAMVVVTTFLAPPLLKRALR